MPRPPEPLGNPSPIHTSQPIIRNVHTLPNNLELLLPTPLPMVGAGERYLDQVVAMYSTYLVASGPVLLVWAVAYDRQSRGQLLV